MIIRFINKYGELKKQIWDSENENRRIDALDTLWLLHEFPTLYIKLEKCLGMAIVILTT